MKLSWIAILTGIFIGHSCAKSNAQSRYEHYGRLCSDIKEWAAMDVKRKNLESERLALKKEREIKEACAKLTKKEMESTGSYRCNESGDGWLSSYGSTIDARMNRNHLSNWSTEECIAALHMFNEREVIERFDDFEKTRIYAMKCDYFGNGLCKIHETLETKKRPDLYRDTK